MATASTALRLLDDADPWEDYFEPWLRELLAGTAARGGNPVKPGTAANYLRAGRNFHALLLQRGVSTDPLEITRGDIVAWAEHLVEAGKASNTRHLWLTALKGFFRWLEETDRDHPPTPFRGIKIPQSERGTGTFPRDEAITKLIAACDPPRSGELVSWWTKFAAARDAAIFRFFLDTGMRVSAVVSMHWETVDLKRRSAMVYMKGGRWETKWIEPPTVLALRRYIRLLALHPKYGMTAAGGPEGKQVQPVWLSRQGALTDKGVVAILERRCKEAGIDRMHTHQFRHWFADAVQREEGVSTKNAMAWGGWRSGKVFDGYAHSAEEERLEEARAKVTLGGRF